MNICKCCGKPIEGEIVMNPDVYGNGYHHFCLINKEFREEQRRIYNKGKADAFKWIPVSERLPEMYVDVLMCSKDGWIEVAHRWGTGDEFIDSKGTSWGINEGNDYDVLAWMPLPEPYKGGEKE